MILQISFIEKKINIKYKLIYMIILYFASYPLVSLFLFYSNKGIVLVLSIFLILCSPIFATVDFLSISTK